MRSVRLLLSTLFVSCKAIKRTKGGTKTLLTFNLILLNNPKAEVTFSRLYRSCRGSELNCDFWRHFHSALFCAFPKRHFPSPNIYMRDQLPPTPSPEKSSVD